MKIAKRFLGFIIAVCMVWSVSAAAFADESVTQTEPAVYGESLREVPFLESSVSGVPGRWTWENPDVMPEAGTAEYPAVFTPNDTNNYNSITANISVTVLQAAPMVELVPSALPITYGEILGQSQIEGGIVKGADGNVLLGAWTWKNTEIRPAAGTNTYPAAFTPNDTKNYTIVEAEVEITVGQTSIDPEKVTPPSASEITYGQSLADSILTGGSVEGIEGTWAWQDPSIKPNRYDNEDYADLFTYAVVFTPADSGYAPITEQITLKLNTAEPVIASAPMGETLYYGQSLTEAEITGGKVIGVNGEELYGTWSWNNEAQTPDVGTAEYQATFYPDSVNYHAVSCEGVSVTVNKAILQTADTPSCTELSYGQSLGHSAISGAVQTLFGLPVEGSWNWEDASTVLPAGVHECQAVFVPNDTEHYEPLQVSIAVTVQKRIIDPDQTDIVVLPSAGEITYGQALADSILSGGSVEGVEGVWSWQDPELKPNAGSSLCTVVFTPADENIEAWTGEVAVTIHKATPVLTEEEISTASDIVYGQKLGDSILSLMR